MNLNCLNCTNCFYESNFELNTFFDKYYYEIHITVEFNLLFFPFCEKNHIKIINVDLQNDETQLMTSITLSLEEENDIEVLKVVNEYKSLFIDNNFKVLRCKVECSINHSSISGNKSYYEAHFSLLNWDKDLDKICLKHNLHKSKNLMKQASSNLQLLTFRINTNKELFLQEVKEILHSLKKYHIKRVITEYCIYDDYETLDNNWIKK